MTNQRVKPILLIMAAGMGSRYGGLKQIDPIGPDGELILHYSLYDAKQAGFERAVIVIKPEHEQDFRALVGERIASEMEIRYAYQTLDDLPDGFSVPETRKKPWGTGHATLSARALIDAPFAAINADDYYGREAFALAYDHLTHLSDDEDFAMVGYLLKNTLSDKGYVARGICGVDERGHLTDVVEETHIIGTCDGPMLTHDLQTYTRVAEDTIVSLNMWAFPQAMMRRLSEAFPAFLTKTLRENPEKAEFFLPNVVGALVRDGRARVTVRATKERWYGVTYRDDKPYVQATLRAMADEGFYPRPLWGG